jgi:hypothetical protein
MKTISSLGLALISASLLATSACSSSDAGESSDGSDSALNSEKLPFLGGYTGKEEGASCVSALNIFQVSGKPGVYATLRDCKVNKDYKFLFFTHPGRSSSHCLEPFVGSFGGMAPDGRPTGEGRMEDFIHTAGACELVVVPKITWTFKDEKNQKRSFEFDTPLDTNGSAASQGGVNGQAVINRKFPAGGTLWSCDNGNSSVLMFRSKVTPSFEVSLSNVAYSDMDASNAGGDDGIPGTGSAVTDAKGCRANDDGSFGLSCSGPQTVRLTTAETPKVNASFSATMSVGQDSRTVRCIGRASPL